MHFGSVTNWLSNDDWIRPLYAWWRRDSDAIEQVVYRLFRNRDGSLNLTGMQVSRIRTQLIHFMDIIPLAQRRQFRRFHDRLLDILELRRNQPWYYKTNIARKKGY